MAQTGKQTGEEEIAALSAKIDLFFFFNTAFLLQFKEDVSYTMRWEDYYKTLVLQPRNIIQLKPIKTSNTRDREQRSGGNANFGIMMRQMERPEP